MNIRLTTFGLQGRARSNDNPRRRALQPTAARIRHDEKIKPTIPHSYRSARFTSPFKATINRDSKINADTSLLIVVHFGNDYPAPRGNCCRAKWGQHHIYLRTILAWFLNRAIEKEAAL